MADPRVIGREEQRLLQETAREAAEIFQGREKGKASMSNQRVVVLTEEEIEVTRRALVLARERDDQERRLLNSAYDRLGAVLEHPEGITDEMVERGVDWTMLGSSKLSDRERHRPYVRKILEAVLFPGDDNE